MSIFTRAIKPAWQQPKTAWDRLEAEDLKNVTLEDCINVSKEGYRAIIENGKLVGFRYEPSLSRVSVLGPYDTREEAIANAKKYWGDGYSDIGTIVEVEE